MNVFITGINGFIGSALSRSLVERGHNVKGSVSAAEKLLTAPQATQCSVVSMNERFDPRVFSGIDTVVHCAYDLRKGKSEINIEGTQKLARAAQEEGVKWQIYVGSYSAHEEATSEYGQTKLELEKFFSDLNQIVVKPGLVVGYGGIFLKMCRFLQNYPVVPLMDGGKGRQPIIAIDDLTTSLAQLIETPRAGCFSLYNNEQASLKELLTQIKRAGKFNAILVPVPLQIIYGALWVSGKLGLPLQVDIGNLKGFQANQSVNDSTDLHRFVSHPMSLKEMIDATFVPKDLP